MSSAGERPATPVTSARYRDGDPSPSRRGIVRPWGKTPSGVGVRKRTPWAATKHKLAGAGVCEFCGWEPIEKRQLHAHHVVPRCHGGTDDPENLIVLCPNHHSTAHLVSPRTYRAYLGSRTREALIDKIRLAEFEQELLRRGRTA
jgi:5-methylcytosine-specific restriction endonuclease McrA